MCGIWLTIGSRQGASPLHAMQHRGPDATGFQTVQTAGQTIELGHLRLSIIDLDIRSNQPMNYAGGLRIVFNGEIYNFVELRSELESLGYSFRTRSDTEVLLAAYAAWGAAMLPRLRGMFALALLDEQRGVVLLARDPFGIKPLFVARTKEGLAVSSEIAPLLEVPGVSRRANATVVRRFLTEGASDGGGDTFFADVQSLPAAHYAVISLQAPADVSPQRYWSPVYDQSLTDRASAAAMIRERFVDSVRLHLRADVPLGTMLSGGIDSSAIVAAVRRELGTGSELHTFSFVTPGDPLDETHFIRLMSQAAGTIAHEVEATPAAFIADIETLVRRQGEPFGSTSIYAQYKVAEAAQAAGIKVLLDGQGADELFAGYRFYLGARVAGLIAQGEPVKAARLLARISQMPGVKLPSAVFHTLAALDVPGAAAMVGRLAASAGPGDLILAANSAGTIDVAPTRRMPRRLALFDRLNASLEREVLPQLLRFEDRNTMAFSIEARVPFLDVPLAQAACRLAPDLLIDDTGLTKSVLRDALAGLVPAEILARRDKIGFATPEARWLKASAGWIERELAMADPSSTPFLDLARVRQVLPAMASGERAWQPWGWRILSVLIWTRLYGIDHRST